MTDTPPATPERKPHISPPPSKEDVEQVSRDQALIADEWAPEPEAAPDGTAPDGPAQRSAPRLRTQAATREPC